MIKLEIRPHADYTFLYIGINKVALSLKVTSIWPCKFLDNLISTYVICALSTHQIVYIENVFITGSKYQGGPAVGVGGQRVGWWTDSMAFL